MLLWIYEELYWQLGTTHILTWRLHAINYLPQSEGAWTSSRKRPPCGLILVTNTSRKRPLSLARWVVAYGRFDCIWHKEPYTTCFSESNFAQITFHPHNNFCLCQYINSLDELKELDLIYNHWCLTSLHQDDTTVIKEFSEKFIMDVRYVKKYIEHLSWQESVKNSQQKQRQGDREERRTRDVSESVTVSELDEYLDHDGLCKRGKRIFKVRKTADISMRNVEKTSQKSILYLMSRTCHHISGW